MQELQDSLKVHRVILPMVIGLVAVGYLFWRNFEVEALSTIHWNQTTVLFLLLALLCLAIRLVAYTLRLRYLSDGAFCFRKALQLIFIWDFSSAVSPTNVGGSAVALIVLAQEKIGAARTSTIVIYTIVLDTLFVMVAIPSWYLLYGAEILGPLSVQEGFVGWQATLLVAYLVMCSYGLFLLYALVFKPDIFQLMAKGMSKIPFIRRYRTQLLELGSNIALASKALFKKPWSYHLTVLFYTVIAWSSRFLLIICLVAGFVQNLSWADVLPLFARIQSMFVLMAFSPTPGGAGVAEFLFDTFLSDIVPGGIGVILATIWRTLAYYFFILMGVLILPGWLNRHVVKRKERASG